MSVRSFVTILVAVSLLSLVGCEGRPKNRSVSPMSDSTTDGPEEPAVTSKPAPVDTEAVGAESRTVKPVSEKPVSEKSAKELRIESQESNKEMAKLKSRLKSQGADLSQAELQTIASRIQAIEKRIREIETTHLDDGSDH